MTGTDLILYNLQGPGDTLTISAAVHSLHESYPGRFRTKIEGVYTDEIYAGNPNYTNLRSGERLELHCPDIHQSHLPIHFMQTWCSYLGDILGLPLSLTTPIPILYLSEQEKALPKLKNNWIINAGWKSDCAAKFWQSHNFQAVVDMTPEITWHQIGESFHAHKKLKNVIDHVGAFDGRCRPLIKLINQCDGGLGPVTFIQHCHAALSKPYVCLNFREPNSFTFYPLQTQLSVNGTLWCNHQGCWKSGLVPDSDNRCLLPIFNKEHQVWQSTCSSMLKPETVVNAIRNYINPHRLPLEIAHS